VGPATTHIDLTDKNGTEPETEKEAEKPDRDHLHHQQAGRHQQADPTTGGVHQDTIINSNNTNNSHNKRNVE